MYARVASFEGGDSEKLGEINEQRMDSGEMIFPAGMMRAAVLTGDEGNRLFVTLFESREALEAASEQFERMGDEIPESVRGRRVSVNVYEVVWDQEIEPETGWPIGGTASQARQNAR
ncbi:MAG: hypothetical protein ACXVY8_07790 [Gaiellaceae bacterium]